MTRHSALSLPLVCQSIIERSSGKRENDIAVMSPLASYSQATENIPTEDLSASKDLLKLR